MKVQVSSRHMRIAVAFAMAFATATSSAVQVTIDNPNGSTPSISEGSTILVDGMVKGQQTIEGEDPNYTVTTHADRVNIYLWWRLRTPNYELGDPGTSPLQMDAARGDFQTTSSPDATYQGSVQANMTGTSGGTYYVGVDALLGPTTIVATAWRVVTLVPYNNPVAVHGVFTMFSRGIYNV